MSTAKRAAVAAILAMVALWPLAHRALVARFELNAWKLFGWAMYTTPTPPVLVALFTEIDGRNYHIKEDQLPDEVKTEIARFRKDRHALGGLLVPTKLGRLVLEARPQFPNVIVAVQRMVLDPRTARMGQTKRLYLYERSKIEG